jgi:hypothetical protein
VFDQGTYTTLDVPGSGSTYAQGINGAGQIVGLLDDSAGIGHGLLLDQSSYTTLGGPTLGHTIANGINASGQIVGSYDDPNGTHGLLLDQGSYTTLDAPGSTFTEAWGINDADQIWDATLMRPAMATASCWIRAATRQ